jgi:alanine racemase
MVRLGILMYGLPPDSSHDGARELADLGILPVLTLKGRVTNIKTIAAGESVGYGRNFAAKADMEIATIGLGYGDGISRQLSNKGKVLINGHICPIVGNVCTDQFMADATAANAKTGDEAVIIGKQGEQSITPEDIASWQNSINYEVVTAISRRVRRFYI